MKTKFFIILMFLILTTGCISISNIFQPTLIFLSSMLGNFFNNFFIMFPKFIKVSNSNNFNV